MDAIAGIVFAALYVTEGWYEEYRRTGSLYAKTRAVVVYDRCLNERT